MAYQMHLKVIQLGTTVLHFGFIATMIVLKYGFSSTFRVNLYIQNTRPKSQRAIKTFK